MIQQGLVTPSGYKTPSPNPLPAWFNRQKHCKFHEGAFGHDIEGCHALKFRVHNLIDSNILSFKNGAPNVRVDLPVHARESTNPQSTTMVTTKENYFTRKVSPEEHLKSIKGKSACSMDDSNLCANLNLVVPPYLKVPDFERRSNYPRTHLMMYSLDDKPAKVSMATTRTHLQNLTQESTESFKEYAKRWKELAEQV